MHRLVVATFLRGHLGLEALGLVFRIIQFREAIGQLLAIDEQLEAVGVARIVVVGTGQRRDLDRMIGDEGRLDQGVLDGGFEDLQQQLAPAVGRLDLDLQALAMAQQRLTIGAVGGGDLRVVVAHGFVHAPAAERRAQVDLRAVPLHFGGAVDSAGDVTDHAFGQVHDLVVRGIGLVQLHHGEFRVVPGADAFVAEVAVDLVHALQATHGPGPARCGGW
ncbi:hypothetical protein G6F62_013418 [Rhizopus arrhizus]|nr:hypothetical protein G6F62_013418 [Rhizopus arrhizus]